MADLSRRFLALVFVVLIIAFCSARGDTHKWNIPHFSDDTAALYKAASDVAPPPGSEILVLDDESSYVFDADGKSVHTSYLLYKVLTQRGAEQWNGTSLSWNPWHQERPKIRARVITSDNQVYPLDPKTISDAPDDEDDPDVYSDRLVVRAPFPAISPGSLVEEEETVTDTKSYFAAGTVDRYFFGFVDIPLQYSRLVLDAPASLPLQYQLRLVPDLKPERKEENGRVQITFERGPIEPLEKVEEYLPSDALTYPSVIFSTGASWRKIAEEYGKTVDSQIALSDVKALTTGLIAGKKSRDEKATAILQYLDREVRYTGVEFGVAALTPRTPAETLQRKYGDCKDKATLLVAMLRAAGIPSYLVLLNVGENQDISPTLPGISLFDHAIAYVPGTPEIWIDATDDHARLGQLASADQGRLALIVRDDADSLVRTPIGASQDNLIVEKREFYLSENGPARIVETTEPHGETESRYRSSYGDSANKDRTKELTDYMHAQYLTEKLDRFEASNPSDISKQFTLVLESKSAKRGATDLESSAAAIRLEGIFTRLPAVLQQREKVDDKKSAEAQDKPKKARTADYQLPEAFVTEWQYNIVPPAGFRPKPLPPNANLSLGPALLTEDFSADKNGVVHATIRFDTVKRRLSVSEANEMRDKVADLREGSGILIYFEPVAQALLNEGKPRESLQIYRDLIALHPSEGIFRLRMAHALLAAGMGEAARDEAHQAVKLEPNSALAQKTLAEILECDLVGRRLRPGSDFAGAEAAYREAQRLDPDDPAIRGSLAIFLEYNRDGDRYGPGAKLKESILAYRSLTPEQLEATGIKNNLAFTLFYAHEFAEARQYAESLNPPPNDLIVASEAAINGSRAAIAEAAKRSHAEDQTKSSLKGAGDMLRRARLYPLAADLYEAGASGSNASNTIGIAAFLRKTRPHEEIHYDEDPAGAGMHSMLLKADPNLNLEELLAISSRNAREVLNRMNPDELEEYLKQGRVMRRRTYHVDFPIDIVLDSSMSTMEAKSEGEDASGYRITFHNSDNLPVVIYIVKEDGKYKILGTSKEPSSVALEVLDRVAANNLPGARILLDWVRDNQHLAGGDDAVAGYSFPRIWTKGMDADAARMKLAAAAILVETKTTAAQGVAILDAARDSATSDTDKLNISLALLQGYRYLDDFEKVLAISTDLAKQYPESLRLYWDRVFASRGLRKFQDTDALAADRLKRLPDDIEPYRTLMNTAVAREDFVLAHDLGVKIVQSGKAEAGDWNNVAWYALLTGKITQDDVADAIKSLQLNQNNASGMHTLGCIYAELNKTKEAREVLIQAMDVLSLDEPESNYWYAFGRIAEQYGEIEVAKTDYARVTRPKREMDISGSSYYLAQNRLKIIATPPQNPSSAKD